MQLLSAVGRGRRDLTRSHYQMNSWRLPVTRAFNGVFVFLAVALAFIAALLAACGPSEVQLSATSAYETAESDINQLRATATVARARLQITLDFVGTRVMQVEQANQFLRSSLMDLGTESAFIDANLSQLQLQPSPTQRQGLAGVTGATATPLALLAVSNDQRVQVTAAVAVAITPDKRPRLGNVALASGVDTEDCALDINPLFTPESAAIYIVARAFNIPAGANLSSIWQRQGSEVAQLSFQTEFAINNNCIWFFIDQSDTPFLAGAWSVEIRLDGEALMSPLPFRVVPS